MQMRVLTRAGKAIMGKWTLDELDRYSESWIKKGRSES
jgi:hypothetical protein